MTRMTFDIFGQEPPEPGLFLVNDRRRYEVLAVRPVDSRQWHDRWALEVRRLADGEVVPPAARCWDFVTTAAGECQKCRGQDAGLVVPDYVVHRCGL